MSKRAAGYVGDSTLGKAVYASRRFKAGDFISKIKGKVISEPGYGSDYCMDLGAGDVMEPRAPFRFLNHSCEPNCELIILEDTDSSQMCLYAVQSIKPNDEMTIDYGWEADAAIPCRCGAATCRGWIVSRDQLPLARKRAKSA